MTELEQERTLRRALLDALEQELAASPLPEGAPTPSRALARSMEKMRRDPLAWARRRAHPHWHYAGHIAAMLAAAVFCSGVVLVANPDTRASVKKWFLVERERDTVFEYIGEQVDTSVPNYVLGKVPDGYRLIEQVRFPDPEEFPELPTTYVFDVYENDNGMRLHFSYIYMQAGALSAYDTSTSEIYDITVNGCPGQLYISKRPESETNTITWIDEEANIHFEISAFLDGDELMRLAKSVDIEK